VLKEYKRRRCEAVFRRSNAEQDSDKAELLLALTNEIGIASLRSDDVLN